MGSFRRRQDQQARGYALPDGVVSLMVRFGRYEFDPQSSGEDSSSIWMETQLPLQPFASTDPSGFMAALAKAMLPVGGWAVYGAAHTILDLISPPPEHDPSYNAIMNASLAFLHASGVPAMKLNGYEWQHWVTNGGTHDSWAPRLPTPSADEAPIAILRAGETRRVAQVTAEADSNVLLVRQTGDGRYSALIESRTSEQDPRRVQREWLSAASLHDLYVQIGLTMQTPPHWYDSELGPYFPRWSRFL